MDPLVYQRMASHEDVHWWFVARRMVISRLIDRFVKHDRNLKILEVGCGTGGNLGMLKRFGTVTATECDETARGIASRKHDIEIRDARLPDLGGLPENKFDLVLLLDVLEHVEDDLGALKGLASRHSDGGRLVITVPAHPWLWSMHDEIHHHFRRYTPATLRSVAEAAGYSVEAIGYYNSLLFPLAIITRFVKKLIGSDAADDAMPGRAVNPVLRNIFALERYLVGRVPMPTGLSLYLVARPRPIGRPAPSTGGRRPVGRQPETRS
jgi:SAM-dependent methyltransferase